MKRITLITCIALTATSVFGQVKEEQKKKIATFGFNLGVNRSNLDFGSTQLDGDQISNGMGYRLGIISNFQFTQRFSLAPKAELSFNAAKLEQDGVSYKVSPNHLEFIAHLKYKFKKEGLSPYLIAGPNFRVPVQYLKSNLVPTKENVAIDVGFGMDAPIFGINISPELRYSFGIGNINRDSEFSDLQYHNIALVINFSGS